MLQAWSAGGGGEDLLPAWLATMQPTLGKGESRRCGEDVWGKKQEEHGLLLLHRCRMGILRGFFDWTGKKTTRNSEAKEADHQ
jgi:hypothetical protein